MARFESLRIKTDGATLAVRHYPGSGDPSVLLHGGPGMGDCFDAFPEVLSPPYRVVSYNQRGCGPSSCDVHSTSRSRRAWRGTNRSVKALGDEYLATMSLDAPVLIVQGEHDVIRETNAVLAARFRTAANLRIENTGHFPWVEEPAIFSKTVLDFYARVSLACPPSART